MAIDKTDDGTDRPSDKNQAAVASLLHLARVASWASDREALVKSSPDVVLNIGLADEAKYNARLWKLQDPGAYELALERSLETVWPLACEPTALPGINPHRSIDGVHCRSFCRSNFPRRFEMFPDAAAFGLEEVHEEVTKGQSWTDDDDVEYHDEETNTTVNQLILVSQRVALTVRSSKGVHGDDDYNADLDASLYICEDPLAMQGLLRSLKNSTFYNLSSVCDAFEFEDKLKACFREHYAEPAPRAAARP